MHFINSYVILCVCVCVCVCVDRERGEYDFNSGSVQGDYREMGEEKE
jgi:hypothetical protein